MVHHTKDQTSKTKGGSWQTWLYLLLLGVIFFSGAYLRLIGIDWDENQHLHPDERFLTMVEAAIKPIHGPVDQLGLPPTTDNQPWRANYVGTLPDCEEWGGYFDTACSPLNPNNRGYDFYVYGTLPIFIVRYVAEAFERTGYGEVYLVGRMLSALSDLLVIGLVYVIATKLYDRRVGILAAAFAAFSVLPIQQSHFFTVDTFTNFFICLTLYYAVRITTTRQPILDLNQPTAVNHDLVENDRGATSGKAGQGIFSIRGFISHPLFSSSILFGVALGMAVTSKINAAPLAITLPGAALVYLMRLSPRERDRQWGQIFIYLVLAAIFSLLAFRVFQPYAFSGPGLFGLKPNEAWIDDLRALRAQTGGDVDFPPALQWARRPVWFSLQNQVFWGLGIPLGVLAWAGFLWMGWRNIKGGWKQHGLLWSWTGIYFVWQSLQWNSTMRYQLPVYPLLAIFAAWFVIHLWDHGGRERPTRSSIRRFILVLLGGGVLVSTMVWAFAFSRIYTQPHTRVDATRWLIQNMPGSVNLAIQTQDGIYNQPISYPQDFALLPGRSHDVRFPATAEGELIGINFPHVIDEMAVTALSLEFSISSLAEDTTLSTGHISPDKTKNVGGEPYSYPLKEPVILDRGQQYALEFKVQEGYRNFQLCGPFILDLLTVDGQHQQDLVVLSGCLSRNDLPYPLTFPADVDGILSAVKLAVIVTETPQTPASHTLTLTLNGAAGEPLFSSEYTSDFLSSEDRRGEWVHIPVTNGITLKKDNTYILNFSLESENGAVVISGSVPVNESSWDDGLPLRMDGYDPYGGIYPGGINFEMYWDDNQEKYERFVSNLDQADTIIITSSRQWGSTTRVPERYPLTTEYYRRLVGCPTDQTVEWCYNLAQPGIFEGELGFELVEVFQSNPSIGDIEINDQFSEEAFTVYDHPKVLIFKKNGDYDPDHVRQVLGAVDLTKVIRITPKQADSHPGNLLLPIDRLEEQRKGGTWSNIFEPDAPQNRYQILGILLWYTSMTLLGWIVYPLVRFAMPGLSDRGYPLARITGLLLLSLIVWLVSSSGVAFTRSTIGVALVFMVLLGGFLGLKQRKSLKVEIREKLVYFLKIEGLFLVFFLAGLLIRVGNPDLWHPWKGGEKPMDFSYFNAVLKSTTFPPYDPWFSGGYINYYYYGFMLVGVLVKFLGIVPSFAYNLILPTLFSLIAMGAFSVVWNLVARRGIRYLGRDASTITASAGAIAMAVLGNLGILQMFTRGIQSNGAPGGNIAGADFFSKLIWTATGTFKTITGTPIPIRMDEWYWNPSRVIAYEHGSPITEFPFFTFLYADLHAHLIALPITLLVLAWVISVVMSRAWDQNNQRDWLQVSFGMLVGGMAIGALYPINLSDIYTYLPLGALALIAAILFRRGSTWETRSRETGSKLPRRLVVAGFSVLGLYGLTRLIYQPYIQWYGQGYSEVNIWEGTHTPTSEYLTHWGFFLFILVSWMVVESIEWMANTPVSALNKLKPHKGLIWLGLASLGSLIFALGINLYPEGLPADSLPVGLGIHITWIVLPLAVWAGILLLRPGMQDEKRIVLFFTGTGLVLTLLVELVVVSGDIGRMNTVFKFYLHTWTLFAIGSSAAFGWLVGGMSKWPVRWRGTWQVVFSFLLLSTLLYPLLGSVAKVMDRMESSAPHSLDGMAYMGTATYHDEGVEMDLSQDYNAIKWMQANVTGSPVIVEANTVEYHWGSRFTIYTGLPGVVGWNWHQRQQRTITPHDWVFERVDAVHEFYNTEDLQWTKDFLAMYDVGYIIFGQLEQAKYAGPGLDKFSSQEGIMWRQVFNDRDTVIYEVLQEY